MNRISLRKRKDLVSPETKRTPPELQDKVPGSLKKSRRDDLVSYRSPLSPLKTGNGTSTGEELKNKSVTVASRESTISDKYNCNLILTKLSASMIENQPTRLTRTQSLTSKLSSPSKLTALMLRSPPLGPKNRELVAPPVDESDNDIFDSPSTRSRSSLRHRPKVNHDSSFAAGSFYGGSLTSPKYRSLLSKNSSAMSNNHSSNSPISTSTTSRTRANLRPANHPYSSEKNYGIGYRNLDPIAKPTPGKILERKDLNSTSTAVKNPESRSPVVSRKFFNHSQRKLYTTTVLKFGEQKVSTPSAFKPSPLAKAAKRAAKKRQSSSVKNVSRKQRLSKPNISGYSPPSSQPETIQSSSTTTTTDTNDESLPHTSDETCSLDDSVTGCNEAPLMSRNPSDGSHVESMFTEGGSRQGDVSLATLFTESELGSGGDKVSGFLDMDDDFENAESNPFLLELNESNPPDCSIAGPSKVSPILDAEPKTPQNRPNSSRGDLKLWLADSKTDAKDGKLQLMIDAGQQNVGPTLCKECGMLYGKECSDDKAIHLRIHNKVQFNLRFPGWKKERVVKEYTDGRVLQILAEDPKYVQKKVEEVMEVVNMTLGFHEKARPDSMSMQVFLFVSDKRIVGALIANTIKQAFRCIPRPDDTKPFTCSLTAEPAVCGINRIWTLASHRRKRIATRLMKCMRERFYYGFVLARDQLAFSDPTPDGQLFAKSYMQSETFLVYK